MVPLFVTGQCMTGWIQNNNRCYFFDGNNWHEGKSEAQNICKAQSRSGAATLLVLNTQDEAVLS
jgi:hypothetical protein